MLDDFASRGDRTGIRTDDEFIQQVVALLNHRGVVAHFEFPGVCRIYLRNGYKVNTGMHDWDYGSWEDRDGRPIEGPADDNMGRFEPTLSNPKASADAVAQAWAACVAGCEYTLNVEGKVCLFA